MIVFFSEVAEESVLREVDSTVVFEDFIGGKKVMHIYGTIVPSICQKKYIDLMKKKNESIILCKKKFNFINIIFIYKNLK